MCLPDAYIERGLHPKNLIRTVEDSATIIEPILPWTAAGVCWSGIVFATIWGITGFGIAKLNQYLLESDLLLNWLAVVSKLGSRSLYYGENYRLVLGNWGFYCLTQCSASTFPVLSVSVLNSSFSLHSQ